MLLLLREARRRRRESPNVGSEAVPDGRRLLLLLERSSSGNGSGSGVKLIGVGGGLHIVHLDPSVAVGRTRRIRRRGQRGDHPPVKLRVEEGQSSEDAGLCPGEGDDGASRAGLGQAVFFFFGKFFFFF